MNIPREILKSSLGGYGGQYISSTTAVLPDANRKFVAVQMLADGTLTLVGNISGITGVTVLAGTIIYGEYDSVVVPSGEAIAYQGGIL